MHRFQFVGSGSAFTLDNYHSSILFWDDEQPDDRMLIDCGSDVRHALHREGVDHSQIKSVYISHLHGDHAGGLEWLGFISHFDPRCDRPNLYLRSTLTGPLWNNCLVAAMRSIKGGLMTLDGYFAVHSLPEEGVFDKFGCSFRLVAAKHIYDGVSICPSFGLMMEVDGVKVYWTSDTRFDLPHLRLFYDQADVIFHDCEISPYMSDVHSHYSQLVGLDDETKAKMWLYHYQDGQLPDAESDGFRGFVSRGQTFTFRSE